MSDTLKAVESARAYLTASEAYNANPDPEDSVPGSEPGPRCQAMLDAFDVFAEATGLTFAAEPDAVAEAIVKVGAALRQAEEERDTAYDDLTQVRDWADGVVEQDQDITRRLIIAERAIRQNKTWDQYQFALREGRD